MQCRRRAYPPVTSTTVDTPVPPKLTATPIPQKIALSDLLLQTRDRIRGVGGFLDGAQTNLDAIFCQQFVPQYNSMISVIPLDMQNRDPKWVEQYNAYKVIIGFFQNKLYRALEVCQAGGGQIGPAEFGEMRQAVDSAAIAAARAYDQLKLNNLLDQ